METTILYHFGEFTAKPYIIALQSFDRYTSGYGLSAAVRRWVLTWELRNENEMQVIMIILCAYFNSWLGELVSRGANGMESN